MSPLRTVKRGDAHVTWTDYLVVGVLTILTPAVIGGLIALSLNGFMNSTGSAGSLGKIVAFLAGQSMAPVFTLFIVPIALLVGRLALRLGWAGWGMAIAVPVTLIALFMYLYAQTDTGYAPWVYVEPAQLFMLSGGLHGLVMWLALRWRRPAALGPRLN